MPTGSADLYGFLISRAKGTPPTIHLPSLLALTRVRVGIHVNGLSDCLTGLLSAIRSAPKPSSITFAFQGGYFIAGDFPSSGHRIVMDKWLA